MIRVDEKLCLAFMIAQGMPFEIETSLYIVYN